MVGTDRTREEAPSLTFHLGPDETDYSLELFRQLEPAQVRADHLIRLLRPRRGERYLDFNAGEAAVSHRLSASGGEWEALAWTPSAMEARQRFLDKVQLFRGLPLPFEAGTFDGVVWTDVLHRLPEPGEWVVECHRILKPGGRWVVEVPFFRPFSPLRALQKGLPGFYVGDLFQPGFTMRSLFELLKCGFDVHTVVPYSRFFMTLADLLLQRAVRDARLRSDSRRRIRRLYAIAFPFFRAAAFLDGLMIFSRGYRLAVFARRHVWRDRGPAGRFLGKPLAAQVVRPIR